MFHCEMMHWEFNAFNAIPSWYINANHPALRPARSNVPWASGFVSPGSNHYSERISSGGRCFVSMRATCFGSVLVNIMAHLAHGFSGRWYDIESKQIHAIQKLPCNRLVIRCLGFPLLWMAQPEGTVHAPYGTSRAGLKRKRVWHLTAG